MQTHFDTVKVMAEHTDSLRRLDTRIVYRIFDPRTMSPVGTLAFVPASFEWALTQGDDVAHLSNAQGLATLRDMRDHGFEVSYQFCAWCASAPQIEFEKALPIARLTHGICPACNAKQWAEVEAMRGELGNARAAA